MNISEHQFGRRPFCNKYEKQELYKGKLRLHMLDFMHVVNESVYDSLEVLTAFLASDFAHAIALNDYMFMKNSAHIYLAKVANEFALPQKLCYYDSNQMRRLIEFYSSAIEAGKTPYKLLKCADPRYIFNSFSREDLQGVDRILHILQATLTTQPSGLLGKFVIDGKAYYSYKNYCDCGGVDNSLNKELCRHAIKIYNDPL